MGDVKYLLRVFTSGNPPAIEIKENEFLELKKAREVLKTALDIEANYEMLIINYLDLEKEILNFTTDKMVRSDPHGVAGIFEIIIIINTRLANLFTVAKQYEDQLKKRIKCFAPEVVKGGEQVKNFYSNEHDSNKYYRFMYQLRNHTQHMGFPVSRTSTNIRLTESNLLEYNTNFFSLSSLLPGIKKKVLKELDKTTDLKIATRSYVESISNVHDSVRSMIRESVSHARAVTEAARCRYSAIHNGYIEALSADEIFNGKVKTKIPLALHWDDVRKDLQSRNRKLSNLKNRYVTGVIKT